MQQIRDFKIQREDFNEVKDQVDELTHKNWEDTGLSKYGIKLNPDWDIYETLNKSYMLGVYTVRKQNNLVGYLTVVSREHHHYKNTVFASNDILFIEKEHRKGLLGYFLVKYAVKDLKNLGADVLLFTSNIDKPYDSILKRLDFQPLEKVFIKKLGD